MDSNGAKQEMGRDALTGSSANIKLLNERSVSYDAVEKGDDSMPKTQAAKSEAAISKVLEKSLQLFSSQGYRATSMRQIAELSDMSVANLYYHFGDKEEIFVTLIERYWEKLLDPELDLNKLFFAANFPDDLEDMATAIRQIVDDNQESILLIYIDVIEFRGQHIRTFYEDMANRFSEAYDERFEQLQKQGRFGDVDPLVAVMVATRWLFYFFTIEKCFGVPMHFGMTAEQAVDEFFRIVRYGVLPRPNAGPAPAQAGTSANGAVAPHQGGKQ
jgi:AcrR family transcriptional regulator